MGKTILTPDQQLLLDRFVSTAKITNAFYLTGGTALSEFYFQHRLSEDFDFFSETALAEKDIMHSVSTIARELKIEEVEYKTLRGQLTFFFHFPKSIVKVDFAQYPFPHLGEFTNYKSLKVSSVLDIGVNKLQAIQTRKRGRDFFDLYVILTQQQLTVKDLVQNYRNKFDLTLSPQELSKQFLGVLEAVDQPRFLGSIEWLTVESYFSEQANVLSNSFITKAATH